MSSRDELARNLCVNVVCSFLTPSNDRIPASLEDGTLEAAKAHIINFLCIVSIDYGLYCVIQSSR